MRVFRFLLPLLILALSCNFPVSQNAGTPQSIPSAIAKTQSAMPPAGVSRTPVTNMQLSATPLLITTLPVTTVSVTPSTSSTPQKIGSPTLSPTITPTGGPAATLGEPDWKTSFKNGDDGFYTDDDENTVINVENGALALTSTMRVKGWHGWSMQYHKLKDFYLEATVKTRTCSGRDEYGLIFHAPDYNTGYFFGITCDGSYGLRYLTEDYHNIIDWAKNSDILTGSDKVNRLGVMMKGEHISLYVNGKLLKELDNATFHDEGMFGFFIAAYSTPNFTVDMDDVAYWKLD